MESNSRTIYDKQTKRFEERIQLLSEWIKSLEEKLAEGQGDKFEIKDKIYHLTIEKEAKEVMLESRRIHLERAKQQQEELKERLEEDMQETIDQLNLLPAKKLSNKMKVMKDAINERFSSDSYEDINQKHQDYMLAVQIINTIKRK
jgi:uncharacterized protein (DUF342 family)